MKFEVGKNYIVKSKKNDHYGKFIVNSVNESGNPIVKYWESNNNQALASGEFRLDMDNYPGCTFAEILVTKEDLLQTVF